MAANSDHEKGPACVLYGGMSLLRTMSETGVDCHVAAESPDDLTKYSRSKKSFTCIPSLSSESGQVLDALNEIGKRFGEKPVLFYGNDQTMRFVSRHRDELSRCFRFLMPANDVLTICSEKDRFSEVAENLSVRYPESLVVRGELNRPALERMQPPFVIKPDLTRDLGNIAAIAEVRTQKALMASSVDDAVQIAERLIKEGISLIIQELIPGDESNIFSYHTFSDEHFEPLGEFAGQKVRTYPLFGGRSTCLRLVNDPEVLSAGRKIATDLRIAGPLKLDFKRSAASGKLYLLEANPRFTLWNHLGAECGVNLSLMAYQYLTGQTIERTPEVRTDRHWVTFADDLRSHISSHSGSWSAALSYPYFRNNPVYHTFAWNDPLPSLIGLKRQFVRRN